MINKIGPIGRLNQKEKRELKKLFLKKDIRFCEANLVENCMGANLTFAHRHKKHWYLGKPDELRWSYNQVAGICPVCHALMEYDKELTEQVFARIRGEDDY